MFFSLYKIGVTSKFYYQELYKEKTNIYVESLSTPRGRILDINGNVLVDNIGIKTIVYHKINNVTTSEEIKIAELLASILTFDKECSTNTLKKYWLIKNPDTAKKLITDEEYELYDERKLSSDDLYLLKMERITIDDLNKLSDTEKNAAYIYSLMNSGYYYDAKIIKKDVSDYEYATVAEAKINGVTNEMYFERYYPYGMTLKSIFGSVGSIPSEYKEEYLEQGYSLNDIVGISYLELEYEEYLKGEKDLYLVNSDGTLEQVSEGKRGNDLVLSIDINMQLEIEEILKEEITKGKKLLNTEYYSGSYVLVGNVTDGSIIAAVGLKYIAEDVFIHNETDLINSSFTVGSVIKGASMAMAYQNNLVDVGKKIKDSCVKLYLVPEKCSYKSLGYIDDITAIKTSSNYYQFLLAIKLANSTYSYNMKLDVTEREFNIYRNAFSYFGLGSKTGIDLPSESTGIRGNKISADLLLNLAIGQYDTYTPIEILQYINTIANNGKRIRLSFMDKIIDNKGNIIKTQDHSILSEFSLDEYYFNRIKEGLIEVVTSGTGYGYTSASYKPAGKTGTSESFFDSDLDGVADTSTITSTYAMYAPSDNPKYSMVVISPNVSHKNGKTDYFAYINRYISKRVSDYLFG
jgi:cell division protein FtsI/penicillin-binding protein 2